jgi:uncharacterized protein YprB with RNaseH-like and TPR domain
LEDVITGREVNTSTGKFLLIDRSAPEFGGGAEEMLVRYSCHLEQGGPEISRKFTHADLEQLVNIGATKSVFLDIETTGLARSPLFLVGLLFYGDDDFLIRQLFARDYSEEKSLLLWLLDQLREFEVVITFNGKAFDMPYIRDRAAFHMLPCDPEIHHLDLLHPCRRRWKNTLPDCRLQTLESRICYRCRDGDIPGRDIPRAYDDFVRTGDAWQINDILHHNALDLLTMSELVLRLLTSDP